MRQRQFWRRSDSLDEFEATMSGLLRPCRVQGRARTRYRTEILHGKLDCVGLTSVSLGGPAQVRVSGEKGISLLQIPLRGGFAATDGRGATSGAGRHMSWRRTRRSCWISNPAHAC